MQDLHWMQHALKLANHALSIGEVPIGACVVIDNKCIGEGFNQPITTINPVAHAEIIALQHAAKAINNYRLVNATLYVTLEPCLMCFGAMLHARIKRLVFATEDKHKGIISNNLTLPANHKFSITSGVEASAAHDLLMNFFNDKRV